MERDLIPLVLKLMNKDSNGVIYPMTPAAIAVDILAILLLVVYTTCPRRLENGYSPTLVSIHIPTLISLKNKHYLSLKSLVITATQIYLMVALILDLFCFDKHIL